MGSKITEGTTNGSGKRKLTSWIQSFVEQTENIFSPEIFRRWTAISTIAAVLEQKVWIKTSRPLYPNLYIFLIGHPGVGKTRTIWEGRDYMLGISEFHMAPISVTWAALKDCMKAARRTIIRLPDDPLEYNTLTICADELGAFMHKYDTEMYKGLSALYDPMPLTEQRRGRPDDKISIPSPQLNIICGTTPTDLMKMMPDEAWGQGFSSRLIMVFSDHRSISDDFAEFGPSKTNDLEHDLAIINGLIGQFIVTKEYVDKVNAWKQLGMPPVPNHPKLIHYVTRRPVQIYKLSMISAIDRSNNLVLTANDFDRAYNWLVEAELAMPEIFKAGATNADGQAMDEIHHFVMINSSNGSAVNEQRIIHFARERIPISSILRVVEIMEKSGMIRCVKVEKRTGLRFFVANQPDQIDPLAAIQ